MMMLASTEEKAILRYLYLREKSKDFSGNPQDLHTIIEELQSYDKQDGFPYGFCLYGDVGTYDMAVTLSTLESLHLIKVSDNATKAELTNRGRGFGEQIRFCDELEDRMLDRLGIKDHSHA